MLIYTKLLISRTHGLWLPKGSGNEVGCDALQGAPDSLPCCACQARGEDIPTPLL